MKKGKKTKLHEKELAKAAGDTTAIGYGLLAAQIALDIKAALAKPAGS